MKKYIALLLLFPATLFGADLLQSDSNLDGTVNLLDLAVVAGEWLASGQPVVPITKPFPGPGELRCEHVQRNTVNAGQWKTIIDLQDGPCIVTNFWMAVQFEQESRTTPVRIYFDGHIVPDIEGVTGELFGCGFNEVANFRGLFLGVTNSRHPGESGSGWTGFSGYLRVPMPYYQSVRIDIQNNYTSNRHCWMMLERMAIDPNRLPAMGITNGMYLKTYGYGQDGNKTQDSEVTLLETSQPTILAGVFQFFDNSTAAGGGGNRYHLEGDHRIYYGGSGTASFQGSGAEDFYHSSWYFQEGTFDRMDECLVVKNDTTYTYAMSRFFPLNRAPYHKDGLKFTWQVGDPPMQNPGNTYTRWIAWYYAEN